MKSQIFLFLAFCFTILSCDSYQEYSQPYEMTVTVVDMNEKPVKNRLVRVLDRFRDYSNNNFIEGKELNRAITNNDGIATVRYKLLRAEYVAEQAWIIVTDDTLFKSVSYLTHVQDYAYEYWILAGIQYTARTGEFDPIMSRTFANISVKNTRYKLDTTITTMVYSKANFGVTTYVDGYRKGHSFTKDSIRDIIVDEF
jgi:hypothetical protein